MKEKFIKSTIILVIGGFFTKILGMISKIFLSRYLGTNGIGIYMMVVPTFLLFVNLASFGFPISISKMVGADNKNNKKLISTSILFVLVLNLFLRYIIILVFFLIKIKIKNNHI